jgi:hypothetical protein
MKVAIGQSSRLDRPSQAIDGWVKYPSEYIHRGYTRAAVWIVDFSSLESFYEWAGQQYAVSIRLAAFDEDQPIWLITTLSEPDYPID